MWLSNCAPAGREIRFLVTENDGACAWETRGLGCWVHASPHPPGAFSSAVACAHPAPVLCGSGAAQCSAQPPGTAPLLPHRPHLDVAGPPASVSPGPAQVLTISPELANLMWPVGRSWDHPVTEGRPEEGRQATGWAATSRQTATYESSGGQQRGHVPLGDPSVPLLCSSSHRLTVASPVAEGAAQAPC